MHKSLSRLPGSRVIAILGPFDSKQPREREEEKDLHFLFRNDRNFETLRGQSLEKRPFVSANWLDVIFGRSDRVCLWANGNKSVYSFIGGCSSDYPIMRAIK